MHRPGILSSQTVDFPDPERSTMGERFRGVSFLQFLFGYALFIAFAAVIVLAFLAPIERHERRASLADQEAFSGYRIASQEQAR